MPHVVLCHKRAAGEAQGSVIGMLAAAVIGGPEYRLMKQVDLYLLAGFGRAWVERKPGTPLRMQVKGTNVFLCLLLCTQVRKY